MSEFQVQAIAVCQAAEWRFGLRLLDVMAQALAACFPDWRQLVSHGHLILHQPSNWAVEPKRRVFRCAAFVDEPCLAWHTVLAKTELFLQ